MGPACLFLLFTCHVLSGLHMSLDVPISRVVLHNTICVGPGSPGMGPGLFFQGVFRSLLSVSLIPFVGPYRRKTVTIFWAQNPGRIGCPHNDLSTRPGRSGPISGPRFPWPVACLGCLGRGSADIARISLQKLTSRVLAEVFLPGTCSTGASRRHVSKVKCHRTCLAYSP